MGFLCFVCTIPATFNPERRFYFFCFAFILFHFIAHVWPSLSAKENPVWMLRWQLPGTVKRTTTARIRWWQTAVWLRRMIMLSLLASRHNSLGRFMHLSACSMYCRAHGASSSSSSSVGSGPQLITGEKMTATRSVLARMTQSIDAAAAAAALSLSPLSALAAMPAVPACDCRNIAPARGSLAAVHQISLFCFTSTVQLYTLPALPTRFLTTDAGNLSRLNWDERNNLVCVCRR